MILPCFLSLHVAIIQRADHLTLFDFSKSIECREAECWALLKMESRCTQALHPRPPLDIQLQTMSRLGGTMGSQCLFGVSSPSFISF